MIGVLNMNIINNVYKSKLLSDSVYYKIVFLKRCNSKTLICYYTFIFFVKKNILLQMKKM